MPGRRNVNCGLISFLPQLHHETCNDGSGYENYTIWDPAPPSVWVPLAFMVRLISSWVTVGVNQGWRTVASFASDRAVSVPDVWLGALSWFCILNLPPEGCWIVIPSAAMTQIEFSGFGDSYTPVCDTQKYTTKSSIDNGGITQKYPSHDAA